MTKEGICSSVPTRSIYDEGMSILIDNMGILRTQEFISLLSMYDSDYTKWHQCFVKAVEPEEFAKVIEESERENPYRGDAKII